LGENLFVLKEASKIDAKKYVMEREVTVDKGDAL